MGVFILWESHNLLFCWLFSCEFVERNRKSLEPRERHRGRFEGEKKGCRMKEIACSLDGQMGSISGGELFRGEYKGRGSLPGLWYNQEDRSGKVYGDDLETSGVQRHSSVIRVRGDVFPSSLLQKTRP